MDKASKGSRALLKQIQSKGAKIARIVKKDDHSSPRSQVQDDSFCGLFESFGIDTRVLRPERACLVRAKLTGEETLDCKPEKLGCSPETSASQRS